MSKLNAKIDFWKDRLLDLGKRNKLINCPAPGEGSRVSRTVIAIKEPEVFSLWKQFVDNEKQIVFPLNDDEDGSSAGKKSLLPPSKNIIVTTNQTLMDTQKTLRNLKQKARTFSEEKGLNALYLAFGFLNWSEKGSKDVLRSPILLVPVQITQEKIMSPFLLNLHDDEIIHNYSLALRMQNDFGLRFPEYNADMDLSVYLEMVKKAVTSKKWHVTLDVELSLFSFLKINMYKDIEENYNTIKKHPLIRAVAGDLPVNNTTNSFNINYDHDSAEPQEVFSVVDADSSQQDAIILAKQGVSFILQGPPGTGKSQTITNIIAELIAEGKRVLFVSEKMAAVEVVYKRLSQAGLAPFCLTLHSHNAKRRDVFDQIENALELATKSASLSKEASKKLQQLKQQRNLLNDYINELHSAVQPLDRSLYYANGKIASLEKSPDIAFNPQNAGKITASTLTDSLNLLEELAQVVSGGGYHADNPWRGFNNLNITNQFRQNFPIEAQKIIELSNDGLQIFKKINELFGIEKQWSAEDIGYIVSIFHHAAPSMNIPYSWIKLPLCGILDKLDQYTFDVSQLENNEQKKLFDSALADWNTERQKYTDDCDEDIFKIDAQAVLKKYRSNYSSFFGKFLPSYWINRKKIFVCLKKTAKLSFDETLVLLDKLAQAQKIRIEYENQKNVLRGQLKWALHLSEFAQKEGFCGEFVKNVCEKNQNTLSKNAELLALIEEWAAAARPVLNGFTSMFDQAQSLMEKPLAELQNQVKDCAENLSALDYYIDYRKIQEKCRALGIGGFFEQIEENKIDPNDITGAFEKCFYRAWIDAVICEYPAVQDFRRHKQEELIKSFKELDKLHLEISRDSLLCRLVTRLPPLNSFTSEHDEIGLLRRELKKQRKLMPARKLMASLPNVLQVLKPCMMLSPLSVSTYLSGANFFFDAVIFDEASQIRTEDAIGSLLRANQAIIAGDSKQLPPSDFFTTSMSVDEEYDEDGELNDMGAFDSLLDEANLLPSKMLLWHYRSRHENLIVFSNKKIYNGNLTTFPSSTETAEDIGVQYIHVKDGVYERGGRSGNRAEAEKAAELVFEHFQKYPTRSLGVIAFGEVQQSAIMDAILKKRKEKQSLEAFFNDVNDETFFVKNLETVQGDERDTIIFSIGYAPDANGKFIMNFGPLSRAGGERRLNVAITRARYNVKLLGSIEPNDIDTDRVTGEGPKLLKLYIDFAINGIGILKNEVLDSKIKRQDLLFETAVYDFLTENGYDVETHIGCSDYKIDMVVRHPKHSGCFAIGIECDGEAYSTARTARERDRLRQSVLENMGWTIYRVWSPDWIKDPKNEGKKLLEAVDKAISDYRGISQAKNGTSASKNEFLKISPRMDTPVKLPRPKHLGNEPRGIPIKEFEDEMLRLISLSYGIYKEGLFKETALRYNWERVGPVIKECLEAAYQSLLRQKKIKERTIDGKTSINLL
jgi:superfamily I DNA and/or RNA helicase